MPIEYEMKYLKESVEDAISNYSQNNFAASWFDGIESRVLDQLANSYKPVYRAQSFPTLTGSV